MKFALLAVAALLAVSACSSTGGGSSSQVYGEVSGGVVTPLLNKRFCNTKRPVNIYRPLFHACSVCQLFGKESHDDSGFICQFFLGGVACVAAVFRAIQP